MKRCFVMSFLSSTRQRFCFFITNFAAMSTTQRVIIVLLTALTPLLSAPLCYSQSIESKILSIVEGRDLSLGVAVYSSSGEEIASINSDRRFAMQSIYKLPIAIAYLESNAIELTDSVTISKKELLPDTWSPFRDTHPKGATISELDFLRYVVALSDNNLCDIMIERTGGIDKVAKIIEELGVRDIAIKNYEREIQSSWDIQFENYATANSIITLLQWFWEQKELGSHSCDIIWQVMCQTMTGSARELLSSSTKIGYKTGFSGKSPSGTTAANNCVGIIENSNGEAILFAIFIGNSNQSEEFNYSVISKIVKLIAQ